MEESLKKKYENITAVIVTYGERGEIAIKAAEACLEEGLPKIIVVDNGSSKKSKELLKSFAEKKISYLKLISLPVNTGSAGGFKKGIQTALEDPSCEYLLLLDDDNILSTGCVFTLLKNYISIKKSFDGPLALFALRKTGKFMNKSELNLIKSLSVIRKNSFFGFDIFRIPLAILNRVTSNNNYPLQSELIETKMAPYGTLFFHKSVIDIIGYPLEEMFLYMDDLEYTYRITKNQGKIFLVTNAIVKSIDITWGRNGLLDVFLTYLQGISLEKIYYATRNKSFFEKYVINESHFNLVREINKFIYLLVTFFISLIIGRFRTWILILKAIKNGENKNFSAFKP